MSCTDALYFELMYLRNYVLFVSYSFEVAKIVLSRLGGRTLQTRCCESRKSFDSTAYTDHAFVQWKVHRPRMFHSFFRDDFIALD